MPEFLVYVLCVGVDFVCSSHAYTCARICIFAHRSICFVINMFIHIHNRVLQKRATHISCSAHKHVEPT